MTESSKTENAFLHDVPIKAENIVVLVVEDSETDAFIVRHILEQRMRQQFEFLHAFNISEAENILNSRDNISIVLLDLGLPDSTGPRATYRSLEKFKERLPIVVLTSVEDRVTAIDIIEMGAVDYIYKQEIINQPESLPRAVEFAISRHHGQVKDKRDILDDLHQTEDFLQFVTGGYSVKN